MKKKLLSIFVALWLTPHAHAETSLQKSLFASVPDAPGDTFLNTQSTKSSFAIPEAPVAPAKTKRPSLKKSESLELISEPEIALPTPAKKQTDQERKLETQARKEQEAEQRFRFYFEDTTLQNLVTYVEQLLKVTFLADDAITPLLQGGGTLQGQKVTFKTNKPLTRQEVWDLFTRLLDLAGLTVVPGPTKDFYRITSTLNANKEAVPTYFDTPIDMLPNNPTKVRYVYFIKNSTIATVQNVATSLASGQASIKTFPDLDALVVTDRADNIRSLMEIIQEFDRDIPEAMSVLKLQRTSAVEVKDLYEKLTSGENSRGAPRNAAQRKQPAAAYFPSNVRLIPEPRTNALVILGPKKVVERVENFIIKHIDTELDMPYSPLHVYDLQNTNAIAIANILSNVITFGKNDTIGQFGGIRDGEKYFESVQITPEPVGNRLIIKAEDNDFNHLLKIIKELDIDQPQVAIEVLIVDVQAGSEKAMGAQLRNKSDGSMLKNVNFQTSGVGAIGTNTTDGSLLGNLIGLATGAANTAGTTMLSIGNATSGVWGVFRMLSTVTTAKIIDYPFMVTTNNFPAKFQYGSTRRITSATVGNTASKTDAVADLVVNITPQINSEGTVFLVIDLIIKEFANASNEENGNTFEKRLNTSALVSDQEVVVLGGITKNKVIRNLKKVPLLGDIPLIGNLFRSKSKSVTRSNLLVFISPKILAPIQNAGTMNRYTHHKSEEIKDTMTVMEKEMKPINNDFVARSFFGSEHNSQSYLASVEDFMDQKDKQPAKESKVKAPPVKQRKVRKRFASRTKRLSGQGGANEEVA